MLGDGFAAAGQRRERAAHVIHGRGEIDAAFVDAARERAQRRCAGRGQSQGFEVGPRERGGLRKQARQPGLAGGECLAIPFGEAAGERPRRRRRDVQREDRAHRALERIPGARDAKPGAAAHQAREPRIVRSAPAITRRVGRQVEGAARGRRDLEQRGRRRTPHAQQQCVLAGRRSDVDGHGAVDGREGACIARLVHAFDAGTRVPREESGDLRPVIGRPVAEPQQDLAVRGRGSRRCAAACAIRAATCRRSPGTRG